MHGFLRNFEREDKPQIQNELSKLHRRIETLERRVHRGNQSCDITRKKIDEHIYAEHKEITLQEKIQECIRESLDIDCHTAFSHSRRKAETVTPHELMMFRCGAEFAFQGVLNLLKQYKIDPELKLKEPPLTNG